ncbi:hypothetical protein CIB48_g10561, partial [Xylaria polymorpha]
MVKDTQTVIQELNNLVNMSAFDLEVWLKGEPSQSAGWSQGDESDETIGRESGRKIVEILKKTLSRDADHYDEEDIEHMWR